MNGETYLGELEQMVLWVILGLDSEAYGARVMDALETRADRKVSSGALYTTLDRLETKGVIRSRLADPEAGRGGRRKRYVTVTPEGLVALFRTREKWILLWDGLEPEADLT